jgi:hypothetical protein
VDASRFRRSLNNAGERDQCPLAAATRGWGTIGDVGLSSLAGPSATWDGWCGGGDRSVGDLLAGCRMLDLDGNASAAYRFAVSDDEAGNDVASVGELRSVPSSEVAVAEPRARPNGNIVKASATHLELHRCDVNRYVQATCEAGHQILMAAQHLTRSRGPSPSEDDAAVRRERRR